MKKTLLVLVFLCFILGAASAQSRPRVAIVPPVYPEGDASLALVQAAISDTVSIALRGLGRYELVTLAEKPASFEISDLQAFCTRFRIDTLIVGSIKRVSRSSLPISLSVFDAASGTFSLTQEEDAPSVLSVFDVSDSLAIRLLEGFSSTHIGFGSLSFNSVGVPGEWQVFVDGTDMGSSVEFLPKLLYGTRHVKIVTHRFGTELVLVERDVDLPEGGSVTLDFAIPLMTDSEQSDFVSREAGLLEAFFEGSNPAVVEGAASVLLEKSRQHEGLGEAFTVVPRRISRLTDSLAGNLPRSERISPEGAIARQFDTIPDLSVVSTLYPGAGLPEPPQMKLMRTGSDSTLWGLLANGYFVKRAQINVDGKLQDWEGVQPLFTDIPGDVYFWGHDNLKQDGLDVVSVSIARDDKFLYILWRTAGGVIRKQNPAPWGQLIHYVQFRRGNYVSMIRVFRGPDRDSVMTGMITEKNPEWTEHWEGRVFYGNGFIELRCPLDYLEMFTSSGTSVQCDWGTDAWGDGVHGFEFDKMDAGVIPVSVIF